MARKHGKDRGLFERPKDSGIWWTRITENGKEIRTKCGSKTAALTYYKKQKTKQMEGRLFPERKKRVPFRDIAEDRKLYADAHHTRKGDDSPRIQRWIDAFGDKEASIITSGMIEREMYQMKNEGYEAATINRYLIVLKATYNSALRDKKVTLNPSTEVKPFQVNNELVRYLTPDQEANLLSHLPKRFHKIVVTAINTGIRQGELLRLTWGDVDRNTGILTIRRSKNGKAHRVPMNSIVQSVLAWESSEDSNVKVFPHDSRYLRRPLIRP